MNRDEPPWDVASHAEPKDIATLSSDDEDHELAASASGFHRRLREKVSYYEQLCSPSGLSRSGDGTGMCDGADGLPLMDVDAFEQRLHDERRRRMAESSPFMDVHLRSTPKLLAKSQSSSDGDAVSPFNVKLRHWNTSRVVDESFETSSSASFERTEITQRTERTVTHQHTQHFVAQMQPSASSSSSSEVFTSVRTSQSEWPQDVQQHAHDVHSRPSSTNQRHHQDLVPRELNFDSVDSSGAQHHHHQPITIRHSVANANSNPISNVVHLVKGADDFVDDLTTDGQTASNAELVFTSTATMQVGDGVPTTLTSTHHHIKVGGAIPVAAGNAANNHQQQRLQQTLPVHPPSVAPRRSTSSLSSSSSITHGGHHASPLVSPGSESEPPPSSSIATASPSAEQQAAAAWYQDYSAHSFQTAAAKMNFKRTNSQYDTHIRQIRGE